MLTTLLVAVLSGAPACKDVPLFFLGRNKNANVVEYSGCLGADGKLDHKTPFEAYWLMKAKDGHRQSLSDLENKLAYGFKASPGRAGSLYGLSLVAFPDRMLQVVTQGDGFQAVTVINGVPSRLVRVFVTAEEKLGDPKVQYVDLFGESVRDGSATQERLYPKKSAPHHQASSGEAF
jgi:hypothetical protein